MSGGRPADEFRGQWENGSAPDVESFLQNCSDIDSADRLDVLLVDQFQGWRAGTPKDVEEYFPLLDGHDADDRLKVRLVEEEFGYFEQYGPPVDGSEFVARFASFSDVALEQLRSLASGTSDSGGHGRSHPQATHVACPPDRVGRYDVVRELGRGTFGIVYLAGDSELDREVAIKMPTEQGVTRAGGVDAFLNEARMVAQLDHPAIVPVYDVGRMDDGQCFVVSRFIDGSNLAERKGPAFEQQQSVQLVIQVARALHSAHQNGLVHRDVKPANILLDRSGDPYVVDFGLALRDHDYATGSDFVGTPAYMSPEQARGEGHRVDARSDVYSLGVILYELLVGRRPHRAESTQRLLDEIINGEVRPPRQLEASIPRELDRICLKALSRRLADRYSTAADFADELETFLSQPVSPATPRSTAAAGPDSKQAVVSVSSAGASFAGSTELAAPIVPKGLRSFDSGDSEFFHQLLPGPRDRNGLPDSIRFWKHRIESVDSDGSFSVGLLYGPSGCGKSSFVKAGLIPALSKDVKVVFVDATADDTEARLLKGLSKKCPQLSEGMTLPDCLAYLRRGATAGRNRVVIFVDQFEQWLHGASDQTELIRAFRQCDGEHVQAVVMVRDDYWMAATRFMRDLEVPLLEGVNSAAVDLFDERHACRVLTAYGRAFGSLSADQPLTSANETFVRQAVGGLADNGKIVCVRLAVFAEMVKAKPWVPTTLKDVGGTEGIGEAFLEEAFGQAAPQRSRIHSAGAKVVLRQLLPDIGTDIRAGMRPVQELRSSVESEADGAAFDELLTILDSELKLITPTERDQLAAGIDSSTSNAGSSESSTDRRTESGHYQLSHDFLVPAIRQWLTRSQRATLRGRTELQLDAHAADWNSRPDKRRLPSLPEFALIHLLIRRTSWTESHRRMMAVAWKRHAGRLLAAVSLVIIVWLIGHEVQGRMQARSFEQQLAAARLAEVPGIIGELEPYRSWVRPRLMATLAQRELDRLQRGSDAESLRQETALRMALLEDDPAQADELKVALLQSSHRDFTVIARAVRPYRGRLVDSLWETLANPPPELTNSRLQAAAALARFDPAGERWDGLSSVAASELAALRHVYLDGWLEEFGPVGSLLVAPLAEIFEDPDRDADHRLAAAESLARFASNQPERLFQFVLASDDRQFEVFASQLSRHREAAIRFFQQELERNPTRWRWPDREAGWSELPADIIERIESSRGMVRERFAFAAAVPFDDDFRAMNDALRTAGFRPIRIRPFPTAKRAIQVAAIWHRDGVESRSEYDLSPDEVRRRHEQLTADGFLAGDLAGYVLDGEVRYAAVWQRRPHESTAATIVKVAIDDGELAALNTPDAGPVPIRRQTFLDADGRTRHCLVFLQEQGFDNRWETYQGGADFYHRMRYLSRRQTDVSICRAPSAGLDNPPGPLLAAIWIRGDDTVYTRHIAPARLASHHKDCTRLPDEYDLVPVGIGAVELNESEPFHVTSIWQRRAPTWRGTIDVERRKANAALAILLLGNDDALEQLKLQPDPTRRTFLIDRLAAGFIPVEQLLDRLAAEQDNSIRRALVQILAERPHIRLAPDTRAAVVNRAAELFEHDPDPGVHGACVWLLQRYDETRRLAEISTRLASVDNRAETHDWLQGHNGHSMSVIDAGEFLMGFRPGDEYRNSGAKQHRRIINRRYAIAATETTVEQWAPFLREFPGKKEQEGEFGVPRGGPQNYVSFFFAAHYCNWLSEQAGISRDQWCYEPNEDGEYEYGMTIPEDSVDRSGYRLPTEAEWEFACRAGTESMFYFGESNDLLPKYAWYAGNSGHKPHPVGQLRPNDFGLFDMLGNGSEITHYPYLIHFTATADEPLPDVVTDRFPEIQVSRDTYFPTRGSGYWYENYTVTAPRRSQTPARNHSRVGSFRVARTLPKKKAGTD